jgi:hypothetical protein
LLRFIILFWLKKQPNQLPALVTRPWDHHFGFQPPPRRQSTQQHTHAHVKHETRTAAHCLLLFKFLAFHAPIVSTVYLLCACMCVLAAYGPQQTHTTTHTCGCHGALLPPSSVCGAGCRIARAARLPYHRSPWLYCVLCTCHSKFNHADWLCVLFGVLGARSRASGAPSSASNDAAASANDPGEIPGRFAGPPTPPFSQVFRGDAGPRERASVCSSQNCRNKSSVVEFCPLERLFINNRSPGSPNTCSTLK